MTSKQSESTLYVGGLADDVNSEILHAAFLPFGEIIHVSLPLDSSNDKHRGFGFVEFEDAIDANHAIDNMDGSEILGNVLRVNLSYQDQMHSDKNQPFWFNTDEYVRELEKSQIKQKMADETEAKKILKRARDLAIRSSGPMIKSKNLLKAHPKK